MPSYEVFAEFYDSLTDNAEYKKRACYIVELLQKNHNHSMGLTLDLACGTGTLTILLKELGVDVYGVDASSDMLSIAQQKSFEKGLDILFLCQRMEQLDLWGTFDTCVCTLDSLNHITDYQTFKQAIGRVARFTEDNGIFVFDVNTVYKHREILSDNTFVYETDEVFCVWQNTPLEDNKTGINLDFFVKDKSVYRRYSEDFEERAYTAQQIEEALTEAGFAVEGVYGDMSFQPPREDEERIFFVARKKVI